MMRGDVIDRIRQYCRTSTEKDVAVTGRGPEIIGVAVQPCRRRCGAGDSAGEFHVPKSASKLQGPADSGGQSRAVHTIDGR